jgi:hypothetical protein
MPSRASSSCSAETGLDRAGAGTRELMAAVIAAHPASGRRRTGDALRQQTR